MIRKFYAVIIYITLFMGGATATAAAEIEKHDGFYFNFLLGGGYNQLKWDTKNEDEDDAEFSGTAYMFKLKVGGAPADNFIIYGVYGFYNLDDPEVTRGSESRTVKELYITANELGLGICYYFMPSNVYLATEIAAEQLTFGDKKKNLVETSDSGWALTLTLGKEWWVSENWGLGLALVGTAGSVTAGKFLDEENENEKIFHSYIGVALTATYN